MIKNQEIVNFLDILLPPNAPKQKRSVSGNKILSSKNINDLYDITRILCSRGGNLKILFNSIKDIATILNDINYNQNISYTNSKTKGGQEVTVPNGYTNMPFLIKQVLYFLCVRMLQFSDDSGKHYTQNDVWEKLTNDHGIKIGHNAFSKMFGEITPDRYYRCVSYYQPKNPLKYMGQKKGRLGIAIKHLVEQAEIDSEYDMFVDVFGGSSSATVVHKYKKKVRCIYNDINSLLINYVKVVSSDALHGKLIDALKEVQNFIKNGIEKGNTRGIEFLDSMYDKTQEYIKNPINKQYLRDKTKDNLTDMNDFGDSEVAYSPKEIENFFQNFQTNIVTGNSQFIIDLLKNKKFEYGFIGQTKQYTFSEIKTFHSVADFLNNQKVIQNLIDEDHKKNGYSQTFLYSEYKDPLSNQKKTSDEIQKEFRRYRAWGILLACKEKYYEVFMQEDWEPEDTKEKVEAAKVLMIMRYFTIKHEIGSDSSITLDAKRPNINIIRNFCEEDFADSINKYHQQLKRVKIKNVYNMDCLTLIKKTNGDSKKILYYVDSPYIKTTGYGGDDWTMEKMKELINALFYSKQKFIFSMRACKDKDKMYETNKAILEVLGCFSEWNDKLGNNLYVLAADFDMDKLEDHIRGICAEKKSKCEIMITNYPIQSFYDIGWEDSPKSQKKVRIISDFINRKAYKTLEYDKFYFRAEKALNDMIH